MYYSISKALDNIYRREFAFKNRNTPTIKFFSSPYNMGYFKIFGTVITTSYVLQQHYSSSVLGVGLDLSYEDFMLHTYVLNDGGFDEGGIYAFVQTENAFIIKGQLFVHSEGKFISIGSPKVVQYDIKELLNIYNDWFPYELLNKRCFFKGDSGFSLANRYMISGDEVFEHPKEKGIYAFKSGNKPYAISLKAIPFTGSFLDYNKKVLKASLTESFNKVYKAYDKKQYDVLKTFCVQYRSHVEPNVVR